MSCMLVEEPQQLSIIDYHLSSLGRAPDGLSMGGNQPFIASLPPPDDFHAKRRDTIIRRSRERFSTPRVVIEDKITRWMNRLF